MGVVFPAYAGMSLSRTLDTRERGRFPRLRGDEPDRARAYVLPETFSPPTRG